MSEDEVALGFGGFPGEEESRDLAKIGGVFESACGVEKFGEYDDV